VERTDDACAVRAGLPRQIEREVEEAVDVEDIRLRGPQHVIEDGQKVRRPIGFVERRELPVVDDLDDGQAFEDAPGQLTIPASGIEVGGEDRDVMARRRNAFA
jgi:hypothetical protein